MINFGLNSASILAQVNFGGGTHTLLGILLAVAGAALYFLRSVRPELSRDHDIFFAAIGLVCGIILISQGWRLDPILQFGQVLLVGSTVFFAVESIRLRGIATEQAKRNTRIVDDDRPVSNYYEQVAELDELEFDYDRPVRPRIPGSRDSRPNRLDNYEDENPRRRSRSDDYDDQQPRRSSNSRSSTDRLGQGDKPRKRRTSTTRVETRYQDEWDSPKKPEDEWNTSTSNRKSSRPSNNTPSRSESDTDVSPRPRKRRSSQDQPNRRSRNPDDDVIPTDYVDYKPVDRPNEPETDNSTNFDEF